MLDENSALLSLIEETEALQSGHFRLASGLHASRFFRCIKLLRYPKAADLLFEMLAQRFSSIPIDYVLGANEAGSILAFEVAKQLNAEVVIARQQSGQYSLIEGFTLLEGRCVLIVDDITTTGGTAKQLLNIVKTANAKAMGVGLVATKGLFNVDLGCRTEVLIQLEGMDAITPEECQLCQAGVPLVT